MELVRGVRKLFVIHTFSIKGYSHKNQIVWVQLRAKTASTGVITGTWGHSKRQVVGRACNSIVDLVHMVESTQEMGGVGV